MKGKTPAVGINASAGYDERDQSAIELDGFMTGKKGQIGRERKKGTVRLLKKKGKFPDRVFGRKTRKRTRGGDKKGKARENVSRSTTGG